MSGKPVFLIVWLLAALPFVGQAQDSSTKGKFHTFAQISAAYGDSDTAKALVHLFKRKNRTGKIFMYASGALLGGGLLSLSALSSAQTRRGLPPPSPTRLLGRAWVVYGSTLVFGTVRTRLYSRKRLVQVLEAYRNRTPLPAKYTGKLRRRDFS